MRTRAARPVLAALVLVLLAAGGALAAPPARIDTGSSTRFALAGDRVLLFDEERPELSVREPDGAVRVVHRARGSRGVAPAIAQVAASDTQVAFVSEGYDARGEGGLRWSTLRAGPLGGPHDLVAGDRGAPTGSRPHDVAIAGAGLLFSDERGIALRPADGTATVRLGGSGNERLAVGGRYAAARTSTHATVLDLETRTVVARLAVGADLGASVPPGAGVSADGTLVYTDAARRLWSFVPATRRRTLLLRGVDAVVGVAGSTAYAVTRTRGTSFEALERLWAVDLAGGEPRPVSESVFAGEFATDGARVVYRRGGCTLLGDLPAPGEAPTATGCPRQSLAFLADERRDGRRVRMRVVCPGASGDRCTGTARLAARRAGGRVLLGTWRFDAAGGETVTGTIRVGGRSPRVARLRVTGSPYGKVSRRIVLGRTLRGRRARG